MKTKSVFAILVALAALRCVWVAMQAISPHEAYYWMCSEWMAPAFFDGPAGTAYWVRAFNLLGFPGLAAARIAWPILALAAGGLAWLLARSICSAASAAWVVIILNALPVFNREAMTIGPAMPALVFVLSGVWLARLALEDRGWIYWGAAGAAFALAISFRYDALLVPAGLLVIVLASPRHYNKSDFAGLALMVFLSVLALWGPIAWNASMEWVPIAGGTLRTAWAFQPDECAARLWNVLCEFSIPAGLGVLAGLGWMASAARYHVRPRFLLSVCWLLWLWWLYCSLRGNDDGTAAFLGTVPVVIFVLSAGRKYPHTPTIAAAIVLFALAASGINLWEDSRARNIWPFLAEEVQSAAHKLPKGDKDLFFIAEDSDLAAVLGYYAGSDQKASFPPVFTPESPALSSQFGIWPSYADFEKCTKSADEYFTEQKGANPFIDRSAIFVGTSLPQTIKGAFSSTSPLRQIKMPNGRTFTIFLCLGYQTLPL